MKEPKPYDLEQRTFEFARNVRALVKKLPRSPANMEDARELIRASGSVGENYIEAREGLSKKDFAMHIKISRTEARESHYWLRLVDTGAAPALEAERQGLVQEAGELTRILSSIVGKCR